MTATCKTTPQIAYAGAVVLLNPQTILPEVARNRYEVYTSRKREDLEYIIKKYTEVLYSS